MSRITTATATATNNINTAWVFILLLIISLCSCSPEKKSDEGIETAVPSQILDYVQNNRGMLSGKKFGL